MNIRLILLPFTLIYSVITTVRNWLYDHDFLHSRSFSLPVICVGNITVGGTGKTPFIEYIIRNLSSFSPAIVSRGYQRKTKGLVVATNESTAQDIGDEPYQMHTKFPHVAMAVDEDRSEAIEWIINNTNSNVVLMDDGFQHRSTKAGFYVLMADYARPMWNDWCFPAGNLRETWSGRHRADVVVVNKCPEDLSAAERDDIKRRLNISCPVFFASIAYGDLHHKDGRAASEAVDNALAIAGIGRPAPFFDEVKRKVRTVECMAFADHHNFTEDDYKIIASILDNGNKRLITTEKDATRLKQSTLDFLYIPIELKILFGQEDDLNEIILNAAKQQNND